MKKILLLSLALFCAAALPAQENRDWAQYGRYERQNAELAGQSVEAVFMGNSITDNWASIDSEFFTRNNFVGRGISGQTTLEMLARFRRDVIDLHPRAVVILAGITVQGFSWRSRPRRQILQGPTWPRGGHSGSGQTGWAGICL